MTTGKALVSLGDAMLSRVVQMTCSRLSGVSMGRVEVLAVGVCGTVSNGSFEKSSRDVTEKPSLK